MVAGTDAQERAGAGGQSRVRPVGIRARHAGRGGHGPATAGDSRTARRRFLGGSARLGSHSLRRTDRAARQRLHYRHRRQRHRPTVDAEGDRRTVEGRRVRLQGARGERARRARDQHALPDSRKLRPAAGAPPDDTRRNVRRHRGRHVEAGSLPGLFPHRRRRAGWRHLGLSCGWRPALPRSVRDRPHRRERQRQSALRRGAKEQRSRHDHRRPRARRRAVHQRLQNHRFPASDRRRLAQRVRDPRRLAPPAQDHRARVHGADAHAGDDVERVVPADGGKGTD